MLSVYLLYHGDLYFRPAVFLPKKRDRVLRDKTKTAVCETNTTPIQFHV